MRNSSRRLIASMAALLTAGVTAGPQEPPAPPCLASAGFDQFDFWLGEWNVYSNDGKRRLLGSNSIRKLYGSCLITEEWQSTGGTAGFSMNYYNPVTSGWRQVWVSTGYSIDYTGGINAEGAMELSGFLYDYAENAATPFRGTWSPQPDGSVIQHFDIFDSESESWSVWFEGLYVRKASGHDPVASGG